MTHSFYFYGVILHNQHVTALFTLDWFKNGPIYLILYILCWLTTWTEHLDPVKPDHDFILNPGNTFIGLYGVIDYMNDIF